MYNILIVDDEKLHRKGLLSLLEEICPDDMFWEAADGTEALDILEHISCEIIISDIRMTKMDGITLLRKIREKNEEIFFVFLSGYAEFAYAREALSLRACAYLLKPVNSLELQTTIKDVKKKIKGQLEEEEMAAELEERLKETLPAYVDRILNQFVQNPDFSAEDQLLSLLPLKQQGYLVLTKCQEGQSGNSSEKEKREIGYLIKKSLEPLSSLTFELHHADYTLATLVIDTKLPDAKVLWALRLKIEGTGRKNTFFAISTLKSNLYLQGAEAYEEAYRALSFSFYGITDIFWSEKLKTIVISDSGALDDRELLIAIQSKQTAASFELYERLLKEAAAGGQVPPDILKRRAVFLFYRVLKTLEPMIRRENRQELFERDQCLIETKDFQTLLREGNQLIFRIVNCLSVKGENGADRPMNRCMEYLLEHYMDEISLESVATMFHFNPSYFSTLFKNTFELTFSDFLSQMRMQKAEKLLLCSNRKVKEIAAMTGYRDSNYFIRSFKKRYGVTPDEFRKKGNV